MTFSIVARDPETGDLGIAVQSKFPAVGSLVTWIDLDGGAIATQALANVEYGTKGLKMLKAGLTANQVLRVLLENDEASQHRQVGIVDTSGHAVAHTGSECYDWAGHIVDDGVTVQGNILIEGTAEAMMRAFKTTEGDLPERLLSALEAGQEAGGDSRGQQSAHLLVHRRDGGYGGGSNVWVDVRVDDHPEAVAELRRVFELYSLTLLEREDPTDISILDGNILKAVEDALRQLGYLEQEQTSRDLILSALQKWIHTENFENKERDDGHIWNSVLNYLVEQANRE